MRTVIHVRNFLLIFSAVLPVACVDAPPQEPAGIQANEQFCAQADNFLDKEASGEPLTPRLWGELMLAGARLVYVTKDCGDRVVGDKAQLCAQLYAATRAFAAAEKIPRGANRDTAINQNRKFYIEAGCQPELIVE